MGTLQISLKDSKEQRRRQVLCCLRRCSLVRERGFEPRKDKPADLQSAAFGRLAIPPYGAQSET